MRYRRIIVGLGSVLLGIVIGLFIPLDGGNAAILGGVLGAILGYQLIYGWFGGKLQRRFSSSHKEQEQPVNNDMLTQHVIEEQSRRIREAQLVDEAHFKDVFRQ